MITFLRNIIEWFKRLFSCRKSSLVKPESPYINHVLIINKWLEYLQSCDYRTKEMSGNKRWNVEIGDFTELFNAFTGYWGRSGLRFSKRATSVSYICARDGYEIELSDRTGRNSNRIGIVKLYVEGRVVDLKISFTRNKN